MEPYASPVPIPDFAPGGDFSVGVEEELMLLEPGGDLMGAAAAPLVSALRADPGCRGVVTAEVYVDQVELNSPVCAGAEDAHASLRALRSWVLGQGAVPAAVGVHPAAPLGGACLSPSPRYDAIVAEYGGLLRTPTAALQVHVGVPDAATAMLAYRGLRQQMPLLRALAAATPYWHGVDSGLASTRSAILRSYPRTTVPPLLRSWDEYVDRTRALVRAAEVPDHTYVWWDLRPRPELGTLEVRVMDAQPSLARVAGLTALVQGIARHAVEAPARDELSDDVLAVNDHRAAHGGLEPARRGRGRRPAPDARGGAPGAGAGAGGAGRRRARRLRSTSSRRCWRGRTSPPGSAGCTRPRACGACWPTWWRARRTWTASRDQGPTGTTPYPWPGPVSRRARRPR